jgi:excisionase family DNA binding protein
MTTSVTAKLADVERRNTAQQTAALDPNVQLPAVLDLVQAAALLGLGRTTAYRLVHDGQWPTPVLRLGRLIKIPTQPLLDLLTGTDRALSLIPPSRR